MRKVARIGFYAAAVILALSVSGCSRKLDTLLNQYEEGLDKLEEVYEQVKAGTISDDAAKEEALGIAREVFRIYSETEREYDYLDNWSPTSLSERQMARYYYLRERMESLGFTWDMGTWRYVGIWSYSES